MCLAMVLNGPDAVINTITHKTKAWKPTASKCGIELRTNIIWSMTKRFATSRSATKCIPCHEAMKEN